MDQEIVSNDTSYPDFKILYRQFTHERDQEIASKLTDKKHSYAKLKKLFGTIKLSLEQIGLKG